MSHENALIEALDGMNGTWKGLSANELIWEIKNNTPIGREFSKEVYTTIISYLLKFEEL